MDTKFGRLMMALQGRSAFKKWSLSTSASVALIFAFALPAFFAGAGMAVDLAQAYNVKARLSSALDKAALAAGSSEGSEAELEARINKFFQANYPAQALGVPSALEIHLENGVVEVSATARVPTTFMAIMGQDYIDVSADTTVKREVAGMELVLVMDNTGSMLDPAGGGISKIDAAKQAATTLVNTLYGASSNVPVLWTGVVPFSQAVNVGPAHANWTASTAFDWGTTSWAGCVEAREPSNRDITDDPPYVVTSGDTNTALFPKYYSACGVTSGNNWWYTNGTDAATNGTFGSTSNWTTNSGWSITGGQAVKTGTNNTTITESATLSTSKYYDVTYTVVTRTAGSIKVSIGGTAGTARSAAGTYTDTIKPGSSSGGIVFTSTGFTGKIDNVSVLPRNDCTTGGTVHYQSPLDNTYGPNTYCAQPLLGMTNNPTDVLNAINSMQAAGSTMIDLGMAWGWRMLSPRWRSAWGGVMNSNNLPLDYNTPTMNKVVILMTDGDNNFGGSNYTAYGPLSAGRIGTTNTTTANTTLNTRTTAVCNSLKSHNVIVYTIALGADLNATSLAMLKGCASKSSNFFQSPTTNSLQAAFQAIAAQLNSLHITN